MFNLECPECKKSFSHADEFTLRRMLGRHRSVTHGVLSKAKQRQLELEKEIQAQTPAGGPTTFVATPLTPEQRREQKRIQQHEYYLKNKKWILKRDKTRRDLVRAANNPETQKLYNDERQELQKSSWWRVEGRKVWCPCCGAAFQILQEGKSA